MAQHTDSPAVLVVEDDRALADTYAAFLEPQFEVRVAYSGEQAIDSLDFEPDVVVLDRRLGGISGEEVLRAIEARNDGIRVAMVTGVQPDFEIADFGIDAYLVKPIDEADLREAVEHVRSLDDLDEMEIALSSKRLKRNLLEVEKSPEQLADNETFDRLEREIERLESEIERLESDLQEPDPAAPVVG